MTAIDLSAARRLAFRVVLGQAGVTLAVALASLVLAGAPGARSALLGGGISTLGSWVMALAAFRKRAGASAEFALAAMLAAEMLKFAVVIGLFVAVLRLIRVVPVAMLSAYGATFLVYWVVLAGALPALRAMRSAPPGPG